MPQDDAPLPVIPTTKNHPPRILDTTVDPPPTVTVPVGQNCPNVFFSAKVSDDDLADQINDHWFIDPDPSFSGDFKQGNPVANNGPVQQPQRPTPATASFDVKLVIAKTLGDPSQDHRVVLVIADGELFHATPEPRIVTGLDGGQLQVETFRDTFTWLVHPESSPCQ